MNCTRSAEDIQALLDGTLGPIRAAELEQHLDGCAACRALEADLRRVRDLADDARRSSAARSRLAADRRTAAAGRPHSRPAAEPAQQPPPAVRAGSRLRPRSSSRWARRWRSSCRVTSTRAPEPGVCAAGQRRRQRYRPKWRRGLAASREAAAKRRRQAERGAGLRRWRVAEAGNRHARPEPEDPRSGHRREQRRA